MCKEIRKYIIVIYINNLPDHQAYGSLYNKQLIMKKTLNPKTGEEVEVERKVFIKLSPDNTINKINSGEIQFK